MRVYLAGGINGLSDDDCARWRDVASQILRDIGHEPVDPLRRDYRGHEMEPGIATQIVLGDQADILTCDALLVRAHQPSWGTAMEVKYAFSRGKVIVVFGAGSKPSPWLKFHADEMADTLDEAIALIRGRGLL